MGMSNTEKNAALNWLFQGGAHVTIYLALFNNGAELAGNGYSRLAITCNDTNFPDAAAGAMSNGVRFDFAALSAAMDADEFRIYDAAAAGNLLWSQVITQINGTEFYLLAGDLDITL